MALVGVLIGGGTASAGHSGGCPASFTAIDAGVDPGVDKNGDGTICTKLIGGPPGLTVFSDIDNNAQGSNLP